ncbi:MAG TPA: branched-chain amino acid ABC transporter permease [Gammaproteobacteria bacterium]|jgi:branched-chain amino acid transport system permease protein|nr:branched-chain amino acid ABC transporter permease [Arenicellales bacterium]MDP6854019.1 branched-chain amino acid ABC transporter permease [Arenicellales bacterium]MDP6948163.1 branched-chain amino acid ABC transporter permease [Arenicellales bacterium]HCY13523.1 branched-chain amino acid ABC transporter permease [Gammaproteobacteria bacterium]|tara:strand:- start:2955 stop:4082 length:1128 start_codon:yes stop_codon:yes gene_type:complete
MFYREAGHLKTSYRSDRAIFPIPQDRWAVLAMLAIAFVVIPLTGDSYLLGPIMTQFLVFGLAAVGLNLLTGYAGQLSLGTGGFMAVGAYTCYNFALRVPELPLVVDFLLGGVFAALVGILFGLPSLRIKGFYLAVATLAAQFFLTWIFDHVGWFTNYDTAGVASAPSRTLLGSWVTEDGPLSFLSFLNPMVSGPLASTEVKYVVTLSVVVVLVLLAKNIVRGSTGRAWMAIRDMDIAAEIIGISPLRTKLLAFAVSSFYCGVAGALYVFTYLGNADTEAFDLIRSFQILFMVIIGGLGSILGSFLGAAFIVLVPIILNISAVTFGEGTLTSSALTNLEHIVFGGAIIFFLIIEPHGFARLWQVAKEKLRLWPFPH